MAYPRFPGKTAWGLVKFTRNVIANDYRIINMHDYAYKIDTQYDAHPDQDLPPCGTAGCFGGWILVNYDGIRSALARIRFPLVRLKELLGTTINFHTVGIGQSVFNAGSGDACMRTVPRTKSHQKAVLDRIDNFMNINKKALKARILPPREEYNDK